MVRGCKVKLTEAFVIACNEYSKKQIGGEQYAYFSSLHGWKLCGEVSRGADDSWWWLALCRNCAVKGGYIW